MRDLQAEIDRLHGLAQAAAEAKVMEGLGGMLRSTRFSPSRLQRCKRDARALEQAIATVYERELELRRPQIAWLERKMRRTA